MFVGAPPPARLPGVGQLRLCGSAPSPPLGQRETGHHRGGSRCPSLATKASAGQKSSPHGVRALAATKRTRDGEDDVRHARPGPLFCGDSHFIGGVSQVCRFCGESRARWMETNAHNPGALYHSFSCRHPKSNIENAPGRVNRRRRLLGKELRLQRESTFSTTDICSISSEPISDGVSLQPPTVTNDEKVANTAGRTPLRRPDGSPHTTGPANARAASRQAGGQHRVRPDRISPCRTNRQRG